MSNQLWAGIPEWLNLVQRTRQAHIKTFNDFSYKKKERGKKKEKKKVELCSQLAPYRKPGCTAWT